MKEKIAVVGGCNMDISATAYTPLVFQDSNPGSLKISMGGVGRNIAENLARLGHSVYLLAMLGNDQFKKEIEAQSSQIGLDLSYCETVDDANTSTYICVNQPNGDITVAVSAMDICDRFIPEIAARKLEFLNTCDYVVIDSNLPAETITFVAEHCKAKLCADAVSAKKAERLKHALPHLYFLKANRAEAEVLSGYELNEQADIVAATKYFHQLGVQNVSITLSMEGAYFSDGARTRLLPPMPCCSINSNGCGDAFFAGMMTAMMKSMDVSTALRYGLTMAAISAEADRAVSPILSMKKLNSAVIYYQGGESNEQARNPSLDIR